MSHEPERIPPLLLLGAGAMIAITTLGVGVSQLADRSAQEAPAPRIVERATLLFADEPDGGVGVYDYRTGTQIKSFAPETGSFVRTALRAAAHVRKVEGLGPEAPFELARTGEGRLLLTDTVTGRTVSLEAFGDANAKDFAQLLPSGKDDNDA